MKITENLPAFASQNLLPQPSLVKCRYSNKERELFPSNISWSEKQLGGSVRLVVLRGVGLGHQSPNSPQFRHLQLRLLYCLDGSRFRKQPTLESKGCKRLEAPLGARNVSIEGFSARLQKWKETFRTAQWSSRGIKRYNYDTNSCVLSTLFHKVACSFLYMRLTNKHYTRRRRGK